MGCQRRVEHGVIGRLLYPRLYTCSFSSCTDSFTQHSARHCSPECRHTDRLMESNTHTHTYTQLTHSPNAAGLASRNLVLHSDINQSIHTTFSHSVGCVFCFGLLPVFAVKQHKAAKTLSKSCPASLLWLVSAATLHSFPW